MSASSFFLQTSYLNLIHQLSLKALTSVYINMKQKIVIQVQMTCNKCRTKALKIAAETYGVISLAIQGEERNQVVVVGEGIDSTKLALALRKKVGFSTILSVQEDKPPKAPSTELSIPEMIVNSTHYPYIYNPAPPTTYYQTVYDPEPSPCSIM